MKISFFAVNNFRGISGGLDSNKIEFRDTNTLFIYGPNNVGKSTFLKAYAFFFNDNTPVKDDFYRCNFENIIEFEMEVELDELDKHSIETKYPKHKESYKEFLNGSLLKIKKIWHYDGKKIICENLTYDYNKCEYINKGYASIGLHTVFQSSLPKPIFIKAMPTEEEAKNTLNDILKLMAEGNLKSTELKELEEAKNKIKELQSKMYDKAIIDKYEHSVNDYFNKIFSDTRIIFKDIKDRLIWSENKLGKEFDIEFTKTNVDGLIDKDIPCTHNNVGHGTLRTAIFSLLLMRDIAEKFERKEGRKDYIVLFEEPELFLYPRIIRELRDLIYQVSTEDLPYQVLCASHSPSMIDISKPKSSIIRLTKNDDGTKLFQVNDRFLKEAKQLKNNEQLKQEMYEILRFNPFICEAFYSDEVVLIEGPTEEIIARAYLQEICVSKNIFILNCGTVTNIPFYQKIFSKFNIKYHVIFDTDNAEIHSEENGIVLFSSGIQKVISQQFKNDYTYLNGNIGLLRFHHPTFEPAHQSAEIPEHLRFVQTGDKSKPYNANLYWRNILKPNLSHSHIDSVPIMLYLKEICNN